MLFLRQIVHNQRIDFVVFLGLFEAFGCIQILRVVFLVLCQPCGGVVLAGFVIGFIRLDLRQCFVVFVGGGFRIGFALFLCRFQCLFCLGNNTVVFGLGFRLILYCGVNLCILGFLGGFDTTGDCLQLFRPGLQCGTHGFRFLNQPGVLVLFLH